MLGIPLWYYYKCCVISVSFKYVFREPVVVIFDFFASFL
jgi:hypothetical protein